MICEVLHPPPHGLAGVCVLYLLVVRDGLEHRVVGEERSEHIGGFQARCRGRHGIGDRGGLRLDECHQRLGALPRVQHAHGPFRGEQRLTGGLDLTELDAMTAQLDLSVGPAEELQGTVVPEPSQVAGAVPAASFVDDELVLCESGVVNVSLGHTEPADP